MHDLVRQQLKTGEEFSHEETGCVGVHETEIAPGAP
jgi:hypothetical protein